MKAVRFLILGLLLSAGAWAGQNSGMQVGVAVRIPTGPQPLIIQTFPTDGSTAASATPLLRVVFNIDMDVTKTDITKIFVPQGLTLTALNWVDARTLDLIYNGSLTTVQAYRVDFADRYIVSVGGVHIPINSGYAFNFGIAPGGNRPPLIAAAVVASPNPVGVGDAVNFAVAAIDPDGDPLSFSWTFGDNSTGNGQNTAHAYTAPGTFTANVQVTDGKGGMTQAQAVIVVKDGGGKPIVVTTIPADGSSVNTSAPSLSLSFSVDMDTTRTDRSKVVLPTGLEITGLNWTSKRTLEITYNGRLDSFGAKRIDLKDNYFCNTAAQMIPEGSGFAFEFANPNHFPLIVQGPSATPGSSIAGQPILFEAFVFDQDGDALTTSWDFGDGSTGTGIPVTHTYAETKSYLVTLTVNDGRGGSTSSAVIVGALATAPWNVIKALISLNFAKPGKDKISVSGVADLPAGFDPNGKNVTVNVGGAVQNFKLNARGQAKVGKNTFKLTRKLKKKVFLGGACKVIFTLSGALAANLADEGFISTDTPKIGTSKLVAISLIIDGRPLSTPTPLLYKAKLGKIGKAKLTTAIKF